MLGSISKLFGKIVARRNRAFDNGKRGIVTVSVPVISVGNISVGGTGKTPVVQMIVRMLRESGRHPAVVMRGYKRASRGLLVVHDGTDVITTERDAGDEAFLHATKLGVPVVVDDSKVEAARFAAGHLDCDTIVLDDGFQHRSLHRTVDVVLIDEATIADQRLLPLGRLREPLTSLSRADVVLLMGDVVSEQVSAFVKPTTVVCSVKTEATRVAMETVVTRPVVAFCGIARPQRFYASAQTLGMDVVEQCSFTDHYVYNKSDVAKIVALAKKHDADVVTTEKDAVKLTHALPMFASEGIALHVVRIESIITTNVDAFTELLFERIEHEDRTE